MQTAPPTIQCGMSANSLLATAYTALTSPLTNTWISRASVCCQLLMLQVTLPVLPLSLPITYALSVCLEPRAAPASLHASTVFAHVQSLILLPYLVGVWSIVTKECKYYALISCLSMHP